MTVQSPIKNAGLFYLNGLTVANDGTTPNSIVTIAAGAARNSTNLNDIVVASALSVSNIVSGVNGLDTGAVANSTFYALFVIGDSSGFEPAAGLLSLSGSAPTLPFGYDMFRRVGWMLTSGAAAFLAVSQSGLGNSRTMWYHVPIATSITAGGSATYAAVSLVASVPAQEAEVIFHASFTPTAPNDELNLRHGDSAAANAGMAVASGAVAGVVEVTSMRCPASSTSASAVDYKVDGSAVALNVSGYVDELGL